MINAENICAACNVFKTEVYFCYSVKVLGRVSHTGFKLSQD